MKTRSFNWCSPLSIVQCVLCIVLLGLSMSVTSCKDDDDDNKSEEQKAEEAAKARDAANTFYNVVSQLTNGANITDDYLNQTFEPTIGQADEGNPLVRIVGTNNLATAVKRFNDLTGANINESTQNYEWKNDAVGTLTWTKGSGQDYGTVEVNIKQMPKLQRIIYRDGEQMGTNKSFEGTAWYRFGDVVKDKEGHYWICVRPAFGRESKQDSHWVCVDKLDDKNIESCSKGGKTWEVPKKLGENTEQMKNFAEMLYAMFNPMEWYFNIENNQNLEMFHDFHHNNLNYHSIAFWKKVYQRWHDNGLFEKVMGVKEDVVRNAIMKDQELNLMCWGHSWWTWTSWNLTLKQYTYSGMNMQTEKELKKEVNMQNWDAFSLKGEYWKQWEALSKFFGDDKTKPRWIIRHAKGKDLCSGTYHEQRQLAGCTDESTFYTGQNENTLKTIPPEITIGRGSGLIGEVLAENGEFYSTALDAKLSNSKAIGIVVYRDNESVIDTQWRNNACGLVMSIGDVAGNSYWVSDDNNNNCPKANTIAALKDLYGDLYNSSDREGYDFFQKMNTQHVCRHPAVLGIADLNKSWKGVQTVSTWFLPSLGEWAIVIDNLARHINTLLPYDELFADETYANVFNGQPDYTYNTAINDMFKELRYHACIEQAMTLGYLDKAPEGYYWTSTQTGEAGKAWAVYFDTDGVEFVKKDKTDSARMRAFCAFSLR